MRDELVDAALRVLRRHGAAALTVRNITAEAGCSTTGIYTYFGGKSGLVEAVFVEGFEGFDEAVGPALAGGDLTGAGRAYRRWALDHPTQYMVMFGRAVPDFEPSPAALERAAASFAQLSGCLARLGHQAEAGDVDDHAYHLFATVHGYVMLDISAMGTQDPAEADARYERALRTLTTPIRPDLTRVRFGRERGDR